MFDLGHYILENGEVKKVDLITWAKWLESGDNRRVAWTEIGDVKVSTVFLGIDHGYGGRALWFETMIFGGDFDSHQWRFTTLEEAMQGHERAVAIVNGEVQPEEDE